MGNTGEMILMWEILVECHWYKKYWWNDTYMVNTGGMILIWEILVE
jgi:hypothetical protein